MTEEEELQNKINQAQDFLGLTPLDEAQIQAAASGRISGTLAEWPYLKAVLDKVGFVLPLTTPASELRWCATAVYWQARADQFADSLGRMGEELHQMKIERDQLKEALRLESNYAARPEPPPLVLGGPQDQPE